MKNLKNIKASIRYRRLRVINKLVKLTYLSPNVKSMDETIEKVKNENYSICRYGDGEFKVILDKGNGFQESNEKLANRLKEILLSNDEHILIGLPDVFKRLNMYNEQAQSFWNDYLIYNRLNIYKILDKNKIYYNAFFTRPYMDWRNKSKSKEWFNKIISIWDNKDIAIIEGEGTRLGVGNDLFNNTKSIVRIIAPSKNAFSRYEEILNESKDLDKNKLILIALGQTATVLAYDLSKLGYQAIDI